MLVLSRKKQETVVIGDNILVTIVEIRGDKVKLGIQAPGDIPVHREEVWVRLQLTQGTDTTTPITAPRSPVARKRSRRIRK